MRKRRDVVISARVRSDSLAALLIWMRKRGVHPSSTSGIIDECVEVLAENIPEERPSTVEALALLAEIGLKSRSFQRQHLALNIEQDVPQLSAFEDSLTKRFEKDAERAKKIYDALKSVPLEPSEDS